MKLITASHLAFSKSHNESEMDYSVHQVRVSPLLLWSWFRFSFSVYFPLANVQTAVAYVWGGETG